LGFPVLIGASRKSFIGKLTDTDMRERLPGSLASALWAASQGVDIIRVHDIKETKQTLLMINHIMDA
jgi:dihydropteroate synthase